MEEIYFELMCERRYSVFAIENSGIISYSVGISENECTYVVQDFTSVRETAIEFVEKLIEGYASPVHVYDIAQDYIS